MKRRWLRRLQLAAAVALALAIAVPVALVLVARCFPYPVSQLQAALARQASTVVLDRNGEPLRIYLGEAETWQFWCPSSEMAPALLAATVAVEDQRFWHHPGVDPLAIARAAWGNLRDRRRYSGASTLTMQVIRLATPSRRTWTNKLTQAWDALRLEASLSKDEILEWYLNLAPYGGNLVGVEAASRRYFGKSAADLTIGESATLAGLPKAPGAYRPPVFPGAALARRHHVLDRMVAEGMLSPAWETVARLEPLTLVTSPLPFDAPHACDWLVDAFPHQTVLRSTIDRQTQRFAEQALRDGLAPLAAADVHNGAVVVVDNRSGEILAMVGSPAWNDRHGNQLNAALCRRSPGSALKPFVYALALDAGTITPASVLDDLPHRYGDYVPRNYDGRFRGPVTAQQALADSLNLPAVGLLASVGVGRTLELLRACGVHGLRDEPGVYGLGLAVGGAAVSPLELARAYAMLARLGDASELRLLTTQPPSVARRLISTGAAYLVAEMLSDPARLDGPPLWKSARGQRRMAWKTGTSYGNHDAWTVAYNPDLTVVVWVGNLDMRPSAALVGYAAAAPIAARLVDQLTPADAPWYEPPPDVESAAVCTVSGLLPSASCPTTTMALRLAGRSPSMACTLHQVVTVDAETGGARCVACSHGHLVRAVVREVWPPAMDAWLRVNAPHRALVPAHAADCPRQPVTAPRIVSPVSGQVLLLTAPQQEIRLEAEGGAPLLHWFVDGMLVGSPPAGEAAYWLARPGRHRIACSLPGGETASITIDVRRHPSLP